MLLAKARGGIWQEPVIPPVAMGLAIRDTLEIISRMQRFLPLSSQRGAMKVIRENLAQTVLDFLIEDLELALTFLEVAETTRDPETARRNRDNALKVYNIVVGKLGIVRANADQQALLNTKLRWLRLRLSTAFAF